MNDWINFSIVEDILNEKRIDFEYDEFGLNVNKGKKLFHLDIYDGMICNKNGNWIPDYAGEKEDHNGFVECKSQEVDFLLRDVFGEIKGNKIFKEILK